MLNLRPLNTPLTYLVSILRVYITLIIVLYSISLKKYCQYQQQAYQAKSTGPLVFELDSTLTSRGGVGRGHSWGLDVHKDNFSMHMVTRGAVEETICIIA